MDTSQSSELRPCPFCGILPNRWQAKDDLGNEETWIECRSDHCEQDENLYSVEAWNTRPIEEFLQRKLDEYEGENKRWHSFETVQAIVKERDALRKQLNHVEEMLDDWFDESGEYLSPILIREQITYIKSEIGLIGAAP